MLRVSRVGSLDKRSFRDGDFFISKIVSSFGEIRLTYLQIFKKKSSHQISSIYFILINFIKNKLWCCRDILCQDSFKVVKIIIIRWESYDNSLILETFYFYIVYTKNFRNNINLKKILRYLILLYPFMSNVKLRKHEQLIRSTRS